MNNIIGVGNWKITCSSPAITLQNKKSIVEADYNIPVSTMQQSVLTTKKNLVLIGYNHKVKILIKETDYDTSYSPLMGKTVTWQAHSDNSDFTLQMIIKRVTVTYKKGRYSHQRILLELEAAQLTEEIEQHIEEAPV